MSAEGSKSFLIVVTFVNKKYRLTPVLTLVGESIPVNADKKILGVAIDWGWPFR